MSIYKIRKTVSFNIKNEEDMELLKMIGDRNFSGYIKELLKKEKNLLKNGHTGHTGHTT